MTLDPAERAAAAVTLVLRVWRAGPPHGSTFRYETTHVQTGEVAYFRNLERAAQHIRWLIERASPKPTSARAPIQFPIRNQEDASR
jgi:hypothetical protein